MAAAKVKQLVRCTVLTAILLFSFHCYSQEEIWDCDREQDYKFVDNFFSDDEFFFENVGEWESVTKSKFKVHSDRVIWNASKNYYCKDGRIETCPVRVVISRKPYAGNKRGNVNIFRVQAYSRDLCKVCGKKKHDEHKLIQTINCTRPIK